MISRFGIVLTYDCNLRCQGCNRYLDTMRVPNSEITEDGLREGYGRVRAAGIEVRKARVTGGEPLLHPQAERMLRVIKETWNKDYGGRTCVFTNGTQPLVRPTDGSRMSWRYRTAPLDSRAAKFFPPMVSPADVGLEPVLGGERHCSIQKGCGRLFDAFGFSFCVLAGPLGRMHGIDPYSAHPLMQGWGELCKHCPFSQPARVRARLFGQARAGTLDDGYPTRSYREAVTQGDYLLDIPRFEER